MGEKGRGRERKGEQEYRAILKKKGRGKRENMTEEKNRYSHSFYLLDSRNRCIEVSFYY